MRSYDLRASPDLGHGDWYVKQDEQMMANGYETLSLRRDSGRKVKPAEVPVLQWVVWGASRAASSAALHAKLEAPAPPLLTYATRPQTRTALCMIH